MIKFLLSIIVIFFSWSIADAEKFSIVKGSTDQTIYITVWDSSSSTGAKLAGLVYNSAGLTCYYTRVLAAATAITLATQTVTGAHADGGFVEVSATNAPGQYRLDLPDAVTASGVDRVKIECKGATDMVQATVDIDLIDAERGTNSAFLASSAPTNFGDLAITASTGLVDINDKTGFRLSATGVDDIWDEPQSGHVTAGTFGLYLDAQLTLRTLASAGYFDFSTDSVTVGTNSDKTGYSISGTKTTLDALNDISTAQVNTEVSDVLKTDTIAEMAQQAPPATPTFQEAVMYLFMCLFRSEITTTATAWNCKNDAGTVINKRTLSDDGTTFTRGETVTGP